MNGKTEHLRAQTTFDPIAAVYEQHAPLEIEAAARLLERLSSARGPIERIIDLGCGTGRDCLNLKRHFRQSQVIGLDCSLAMVSQAANRGRHLRIPFLRPRGSWTGTVVQAALDRIPFPDHSTDLLFSNMALQWTNATDSAINEFRRVLRPDGMLLFSSLGPGALNEITRMLDQPGEPWTIPPSTDLQTLGDQLLTAGFSEPVVDADMITLTYPGPEKMFGELARNGALGMICHEQSDDTEAVAELIRSQWMETYGPGACTLSYEVIFGTAFGPPEGQPRKTPDGDVATFSVDSLKNARPE